MHCNPHFYQLIFTIFAFAFSTVSVALVLVPVKNNSQIHVTNSTATLPPSYFISNDFDTIVKTQGNRNASFLFSFIGYMQALWRKNSDKTSSSYIPFSEQAFAKSISDLCSTENGSKYCDINGKFTTENFPIALLPALIHDMPDLRTALYPESICPYKDDLSSEFTCDSPLPSSNPLSFSINNVTSVFTVESMKQLIYDKEEPIILSMPYPYARIYTQTDDSSVGTMSIQQQQILQSQLLSSCHRRWLFLYSSISHSK